MSSPTGWYKTLPAITRAYGTICVVATTAYRVGLYDPPDIALLYPQVFYRFQVWRLFTNFFFLGPFSINFVIRLLIIARYGVLLEKGAFERQTAEFLWMMICGALALLVLSTIPFLWTPFLAPSLVFMLVYIWSRKFPKAQINICGPVAFKGYYLPWVMLTLDVIFGSPIIPSMPGPLAPFIPGLLGFFAGYLYYFLTVLRPVAGRNNVLKTPMWVGDSYIQLLKFFGHILPAIMGYSSLPPISKAYGTICVVATAAYQVGLYHPYISRVVHGFQIWRLVANFFLLGPFSINSGIYLLMILKYGVQLEKGPFERRADDFSWMMILGAIASLVTLFWTPFLAISTAFMLLFIWSRNFPNVQTNVLGLFALQACYLPYAMVAFDVAFGSSIIPDVSGIIAGYIYYSLTSHPLAVERNILRTPVWLYPSYLQLLQLFGQIFPVAWHITLPLRSLDMLYNFLMTTAMWVYHYYHQLLQLFEHISPVGWYNTLPPISKAYGTVCVVATVAYQIGLYHPYISIVVHGIQIWRLVANFFLLGSFPINSWIYLLIILWFGVQLEKGPYERRTADFLWMMILGAIASLVTLFWTPFLAISNVFMLVCIWSRNFPNDHINVWGFFYLKACYLPLPMLTLDVAFGSPIMPDLLGIVVGYVVGFLYYFLTVSHPLPVERNILRTPVLIINFVVWWRIAAFLVGPLDTGLLERVVTMLLEQALRSLGMPVNNA